uniref:Uncharacterized protein n=1 Tax=Peronospora matthiolae TaxID=2874970 RepID=A0AAV1TT51_9STRA
MKGRLHQQLKEALQQGTFSSLCNRMQILVDQEEQEVEKDP